jgi:hypothetical protein
MAKIIQLHSKRSGKTIPVFVNIDSINWIEHGERIDNPTIIFFGNKHFLAVIEPTDQVLKIINNIK